MAAPSFKILGVDPGTNITGYSIIAVEGKTCQVLDAGVFDLRKCEDHQTKLKEIYLQVQEVIETYLPKHLAIEAPFYGKNVQSMLKLGRAQGVAMAAAITMGLDIYEYAPKRIKQAITGRGTASKEQVAAMLQSRRNFTVKANLLDATDALAAAVCHWQQINSPNGLSQGSKHKDWKSFVAANKDRVR